MATWTGNEIGTESEARGGCVVILWIVLMMIFGFLCGVTWANANLPDCQEDEVLTWEKGSYEGPDEIKTVDLRCAHPDNLSETP